MARPRAEIKQEEFEKLCSLMCTEEEIAGFFNVSSDTLNRWCKKTYRLSFFEVRAMKCSKGKIAIRRYQMKLAEKYPQYQFEKHKGYGTKLHYEMLDKYGISEVHRKTFLKKYLEKKNEQ